MNVAAIIVTRGDQDLNPVVAGLPEEWDTLIWDNGSQGLWRNAPGSTHVARTADQVPDLSVYGRYAAIAYTDAELIYVQDDDCVVSDPQALVIEWEVAGAYPFDGRGAAAWGSDPRDAKDHVVCNMPPEFRHDFYDDHALVGFGACFHRDAPQRAFDRLGLTALPGSLLPDIDFFYRTCDIVFTGLTPRVLVDVPVENLPYAYHYDRMYRQPQHMAERARMRELVLEVRDAA